MRRGHVGGGGQGGHVERRPVVHVHEITGPQQSTVLILLCCTHPDRLPTVTGRRHQPSTVHVGRNQPGALGPLIAATWCNGLTERVLGALPRRPKRQAQTAAPASQRW